MDLKLWKLLSILLAIMLLFASLILFYVGMAFIDFKSTQWNITYSCDEHPSSIGKEPTQ